MKVGFTAGLSNVLDCFTSFGINSVSVKYEVKYPSCSLL